MGWPLEVLRAGRRDAAVVVMPPHGLSLEEVAYPADAELAGAGGPAPGPGDRRLTAT